MFSLIITIISIALVAALALATLYYGGDAFNRGSAAAVASQLINEGQQVNGAYAIAQADAAAGGTAVTTWGGLVTGEYLSQLPASLGLVGTDTIGEDAVVEVAGQTADVCAEINKRAGHEAADLTGGAQPGVYGCSTSGDPAVNTFYFKM